jgi:hypothetical protein
LHDGAHHSVSTYAWLGLLLAIGYYAKAIFLYFALFILGATVIHGFRTRRSREPLTAVRDIGGTVCDDLVANGRPIHCGRQRQIKLRVVPKPTRNENLEKGSAGGAPIPFYPGAIVFDSPRVFRLPSIAGVAYAPWYDASRLDKRRHPALNLRDQLRQLAINFRYPREQLLGAGAALTVPWLILFWYAPGKSLRNLATMWFCTLPVAVVIGMYLLVNLVQRFVLGFSLVLWGAAWALIFIPPGLHLMARRAMLAGTLVFAAYTMPGLLHYVVSRRTESIGRDITVAGALPRYGIAPGSAVASMGDRQEAYWAHFADVSVVAEVLVD